MSHRAQQIIDKVALLLETQTGFPSHVQHALTLGAENNELPAYAVFLGSESAEEADYQTIGSELQLIVTAYAQGTTERLALNQLFDLRTQAHIALMANSTLGLSFVSRTLFGGADAPEILAGSFMNGRQSTTWLVHYEMNITDPS